jgi:aspartate-semialdehyde dehydrogenase
MLSFAKMLRREYIACCICFLCSLSHQGVDTLSSRGYSVAVAGATGLVGRTMLSVLEERNFPVSSLTLLASKRSAGTTIPFKGKSYTVQELTHNSFRGVDIALFSAGGLASKEFAPSAVQAGCVVVDNSSAWRMHPHVPLVVPEVNAHALRGHHGIIANPNCSTIQLVVILKPLHDAFELQRVVCSTYQSVSGAGNKGVEALQAELRHMLSADAPVNSPAIGSPFPLPVAYNTVFHTIKEKYGFSEEETKMLNETRKIMELPHLRLAVTCVRVPTLGAHGESVTIETSRPAAPADIESVLSRATGVVVCDEPHNNIYPTPRNCDGRNEVFVGHIRPDSSVENGAYLWIVADNIRKGAATNAVQIAEALVASNTLSITPLPTAASW